MRDLDYRVIACAIRKDEHARRYGAVAFDPYVFALEVLVERFCFELRADNQRGSIIYEQRGHRLDHQLDLAWQRLRENGTRSLSSQTVNERIANLVRRAKQENLAGLQLADLIVSPIGRYVVGRPPREDFNIIESKFRRRPDGSYISWGLVVLPKE